MRVDSLRPVETQPALVRRQRVSRIQCHRGVADAGAAIDCITERFGPYVGELSGKTSGEGLAELRLHGVICRGAVSEP